MKQHEGESNPAGLTEVERELVRRHRKIAGDWQYKQQLKIKILTTAHDYHLWGLSNSPCGSSDVEMFFGDFGYAKDDLGECDIIYKGVRALLDSLEKIRF